MSKLWLDDVRKPPDETWMWVKTVAEAIAFCESNPTIERMSLDHDLGGQPAETGGVYDFNEPTGLEFAKWVAADVRRYPLEMIKVHSVNPEGALKMRMVLGLSKAYCDPEWRTH